MLAFCIYYLTLCTALPLWGSPLAISAYDETCVLDNRAYTGIRIYRNRTIDVQLKLSLDTQVTIVDCDRGVELHRQILPSNHSIFNQSINLSSEKDIWIARRPKYINKDQLRYFPGALVGGVYQTNGEKSTAEQSQWEPVSPLVADSWTISHYGLRGHTNSTQIWLATSMLRSPDVLEPSYTQSTQWTEQIPVLEAAEV